MLMLALHPPLPLLSKVRILSLLYCAAAACTAAAVAYTPRPCSAMAARAAVLPSPASAPALKGAHAVAAVSRCCCSCCLHPSPLQCNGRTCCCPPFSRLFPCSKGAHAAAAASRCCCIALLFALLLLTPLAPAVQWPHGLLPSLFSPLLLLSKVHMLLPLYRAAAACTAAAVAYTPRPCSAMAAWAVVLPSHASVPALKGATAAAVSRCCCLHCGLHCCLHPSPLQCNGHTC